MPKKVRSRNVKIARKIGLAAILSAAMLAPAIVTAAPAGAAAIRFIGYFYPPKGVPAAQARAEAERNCAEETAEYAYENGWRYTSCTWTRAPRGYAYAGHVYR
ncbi:hypothetical protein Pta02_41480 [Planobispora takensis]|uniref:Uncharacterized protein n=1 Tax=Planobispora takensis TaxID=1367882 RepID=A0A8J3WUI8_9ACTN|nr:hypothetical protein Pta02_41480 [Planobispora takensis]